MITQVRHTGSGRVVTPQQWQNACMRGVLHVRLELLRRNWASHLPTRCGRYSAHLCTEPRRGDGTSRLQYSRLAHVQNVPAVRFLHDARISLLQAHPTHKTVSSCTPRNSTRRTHPTRTVCACMCQGAFLVPAIQAAILYTRGTVHSARRVAGTAPTPSRPQPCTADCTRPGALPCPVTLGPKLHACIVARSCRGRRRRAAAP